MFDEHRHAHVQNLIDYLESRDIYTAGRYGRWEYFSMEDSILSGKDAAEAVTAKIHTYKTAVTVYMLLRSVIDTLQLPNCSPVTIHKNTMIKVLHTAETCSSQTTSERRITQ